MANPYRDNMDRIQALVKRVSREHMYTTQPEERYMSDSTYGMNFVVVSGGEPFDAELKTRLTQTLKEATGEPDPTSM